MFSLFDEESEPQHSVPQPVMMSDSQRAEIRSLFGALDIRTAREQFDYVADVTGKRIGSVGELDGAAAQLLIRCLHSRVASRGQASTGNSWDDRTEDTWIDRL